MHFDEYLFADYSGAISKGAQRKCIRLAAAASEAPVIVERRMTREDLVDELTSRLEEATRGGRRVCFGQDHQYGVPFGLVNEISLSDRPWREVVDALATGTYGADAPPLGHPKLFAKPFNDWLVARGRSPYFYSATKSAAYGLPRSNPRAREACYRLTESCRSVSGTGSPKAFNRVGDPGTVGGQSLVGIMAIRSLLAGCCARGISVAVWPFDGLSIDDPAYLDAHVMIEPYPSAVRPGDVLQTDESDALACVRHTRDLDRAGSLAPLLDLRTLPPEAAAVVRLEGWIVTHDHGNKRSFG